MKPNLHHSTATCVFLLASTATVAQPDPSALFFDLPPSASTTAIPVDAYSAVSVGNLIEYSGIPDAFPDFDIPARFLVTGGWTLGFSTQVSLSSSLLPEDAQDELSASAEAAGFVNFATLTGRPLNEFIVIEKPRSNSSTFCRDDVGYLSITVMPDGRASKVTVNHVHLPNFVSCLEESRRTGFSLYALEIREMMQNAPVLQLPQGALITHAPVIGSTSHSPYSYATNATFQVDMSLTQLFESFEGQAEAQGWQFEHESLGSVSANGNWRKTNSAGESLHMGITLIQQDAYRWFLEMRVSRIDTP